MALARFMILKCVAPAMAEAADTATAVVTAKVVATETVTKAEGQDRKVQENLVAKVAKDHQELTMLHVQREKEPLAPKARQQKVRTVTETVIVTAINLLSRDHRATRRLRHRSKYKAAKYSGLFYFT